MGKEERKEEFKEKIDKLIEEFIDLSVEDIKNIFDYYADGAFTIVHNIIDNKKPEEIVVKRFYAEYLRNDGIWFQKGDKRHGYLAADGKYYMNISDNENSGVTIYFFGDSDFFDSFKIIEDETI